MMIIFVFLFFAFLGSFFCTLFLRHYALRNNVIDVPNERSSHSTPTPRGGGIAIVLCFFGGLAFLWTIDLLANHIFYSFLGAGAIVALTGFVDDHGHIAARWRLLAHFLAAAWGMYWLGGFPVIQVFGFNLDLGWIGHALATIYLVWMLNLYNFMDGINGIAGIEAVTVSLGGVVLFLLGDFGDISGQLPVLLLVVATLGFLIWNFPVAKIFMGDAGSGFVGLLLGLFSIAALRIDEALFWGWIILLGAFIVDATVTLIRRVLNGKAFYEAHRSHAYQYLSRRIGAHKPVSLLYGAINLLVLLPIAALVVCGTLNGVIGVIVAYLPLALLAVWLKAGDEVSQSSSS